MLSPSRRTRALDNEIQARDRQIVLNFRRHLKDLDRSRSTIDSHMATARHFAFWLAANQLNFDAIDARIANRFLNHDCQCQSPHGFSRGWDRHRNYTVVALFRYLVETGHVPRALAVESGIELVERFLNWLLAQGYSPATIYEYRSCCRHLIVWLYLSEVALSEAANESVQNRFLHHDCSCTPSIFFRRPGRFRKRPEDAHRISILIRFLAGEGVVVEPGSPRCHEQPEPHLNGFLHWLVQHRGVSEQTTKKYGRLVLKLLKELGDNPSRYDAMRIRNALLRHLETGSRARAQQLTSALRIYLRYLAAAGLCSPGLVDAVPTVPSVRLAALPRYLDQDDIERVIKACDVTTHNGIRDKSILLLLARLALRAGDIVNLRLTDLDWSQATILVSGKSQPTRLPLPQDVGDALKDYIVLARPRVDEDKVFLRSVAPRHLPFRGSSAISSIVRRALKRAGLESGNQLAAHLFRHSAATWLLRSGTPLEVVGALLRHQSPQTTAIYAKVDVPMLHEVTQPWPFTAGGGK